MMSSSWGVRARGLNFPEGPVYLGGGRAAVAEMQGGSIALISASGDLARITGLHGAPNGLVSSVEGGFYVANNGGLSVTPEGSYWRAADEIDSCVQQVDASGAVSTLAVPGAEAGARLNDLCFGPNGRLYVTDSANWDDLKKLSPGRVLSMSPGGDDVRQEATVVGLANGIAFMPGGDRLLVALSMSRRIIAYPVTQSGLGEPSDFCVLPGGSPDGMCIDLDGNVYVCGSSGDAVYVFDSAGRLVDEMATPRGSQPTNCCLGDGLLYVTLSFLGELVVRNIGAEALPLYSGKV